MYHIHKNYDRFQVDRGKILHHQPINVMYFSPNGEYLAAGYDDGSLLICDTSVTPWEPVRVYKTGATIQGLAWHPTRRTALIVGSGNGDLNKLRFAANGKTARGDYVGLERLTDFIHTIAINFDGSQIAVAYGRRIAFIDTTPGFEESWNIAPEDSISTKFVHESTPRVFTAGDIQYIDSQTILVSFTEADAPFIAYSAIFPYQERWIMKSRSGPHIRTGRSAISPSDLSGYRLLAVTNLRDGIDWYCLHRKRYMMSTQFELGKNIIVGVEFIDGVTVIVGQGKGKIVIATFGMANEPVSYYINALEPALHIQCLSGFRRATQDRRLTIAAAISNKATGTTSILQLIAVEAVDQDSTLQPQPTQSQAPTATCGDPGTLEAAGRVAPAPKIAPITNKLDASPVRGRTPAAKQGNTDARRDTTQVVQAIQTPGIVENVPIPIQLWWSLVGLVLLALFTSGVLFPYWTLINGEISRILK